MNSNFEEKVVRQQGSKQNSGGIPFQKFKLQHRFPKPVPKHHGSSSSESELLPPGCLTCVYIQGQQERWVWGVRLYVCVPEGLSGGRVLVYHVKWLRMRRVKCA